MWCTVALAWLLLRFASGGLTLVWVAFLLTSPLVPVLSWRRFRRRVRDLEADLIVDDHLQATGHPTAPST